MARFEPGETIKFTYNHPAEGMDESTGDRFKEVLVLHPNWMGKVHGIDLKRLTTAEREVIHEVMDPQTRVDVLAGRRHRLPLVNDVVRRMNPVEDIKNPVSFYTRFVKVFLRQKDAYRTYWPGRMFALTVVKRSEVRGTVYNPKPLFHKVESKPTAPKTSAPTTSTAPAKPVNRLDLIRQRAQQLKKPQ